MAGKKPTMLPKLTTHLDPIVGGQHGQAYGGRNNVVPLHCLQVNREDTTNFSYVDMASFARIIRDF